MDSRCSWCRPWFLVSSSALSQVLRQDGGRAAGWLRSGPLSLFVYATPRYWLAILSVFVFVHIPPVSSLAGSVRGYGGVDWIVDVLWHMALPVAVLTVFNASYYVILMRDSVVGEGRGLCADHGRSVWRNVISSDIMSSNAVLPVITMIALDFGFLVSGASCRDHFSWGGMGTLIYDAVIARDYHS